MRIYDVSMLIAPDMPVYKNREENRPQLHFSRLIPKDSSTETTVTMNVHTGTHIDAPFHMSREGTTIENVDLGRLLRPCRVLDLTHVEEAVTKDDLAACSISRGEFILLKTKNSYDDDFCESFIYLHGSGAEYMADAGISGVGIDALGIERNQPGHETHKSLMSEGIVIIEGLRLKDVPPGEYFMCALPLKIKGADGAPARVVLMEKEGAANTDEKLFCR